MPIGGASRNSTNTNGAAITSKGCWTIPASATIISPLMTAESQRSGERIRWRSRVLFRIGTGGQHEPDGRNLFLAEERPNLLPQFGSLATELLQLWREAQLATRHQG